MKWSGWRVAPRYVNDRWASETARSLGHLAPRQEWTHLFINRIYWGLYALSERPDEHFAALHLKKEGDDLDVFNGHDLRHGTEKLRTQSEQFLQKDFSNTPQAFKELKKIVDLPALIDHLICQIYQGKTDWPRRNYFLVAAHTAEPRLRFGAWDSEIGFHHKGIGLSSAKENSLRHFPLGTPEFMIDKHGPGFWFKHLSKSAEFRLQLADRLHALTSPSGALFGQNAAIRYRHLLEEVTPLLYAESARWGNATRKTPYTPYGEEWDSLTAPDSWLFLTFFPNRPRALKQHFQEQKIWPHIEPAYCSFKKSPDRSEKLWISNPNPQGIVVYTLDGSDPRKPWEGTPQGKAFREPLNPKRGTLVKARILSHQKWSPLTVFEVP